MSNSEETPIDPRARKAATKFVAQHGTPTRAVTEPVGTAGVRLVLVGADGAMGDVLVPTADAAAAVVDAVDGVQPAEWDAETVATAEIGPEHRHRMGHSVTRA